jgi:glyoxylase-like metal-dependent hydrolase (beta-lactamase superfamily II)
MKVVPLRSPESVYSGWSYLLLGEWNRLEDVNTLIDTGTDGSIIDLLPSIYTGVGKRQVDLVLLTHSHFDHAGGVSRIVQKFACPVCAMVPTEGVTRIVRDREILRVGDREAEIMACGEHSNDSLCVYVHEEGALFSGDTPLVIRSPGGSYSEDFLNLLGRLARLPVCAIYSGHDAPVLSGAREVILTTLAAVEHSTIIS